MSDQNTYSLRPARTAATTPGKRYDLCPPGRGSAREVRLPTVCLVTFGVWGLVSVVGSEHMGEVGWYYQ